MCHPTPHPQLQMLAAKKQQDAASLACRIYVGSLTYELGEDVLMVPFSVFGPITKIDMPKENGRSKGFCFIEYATPEQATNAITAMNGFVLNGRQIKVNRPTQAGAPAVSMLGAGAGGLPAQFGLPGAGGAASLGSIPVAPSILQAQAAQAEAAAKLAAIGVGAGVGAGMAAGAAGAGAAARQQKHRIYVGSVFFELTAEQLKEVFEPFGTVVSCTLINNPETGKHKGYGFIEFDNEKSVTDAIATMDGFELCNRKLKVSTASVSGAGGGSGGGDSAAALGITAAAGYSVASLTAQAKALVAGSSGGAASAAAGGASGAASTASVGGGAQQGSLICMRNMIGASDVDDDFNGEVREECEQFGAVDRVHVFVDPLPARDEDAVKVFIKFATHEAAAAAQRSLHQRWFGGRVVQCEFFDEFKFARGDYQ